MSESYPIPSRASGNSWTKAINRRSVTATATMILMAILAYPALLSLFFWSGRIATQGPDLSSRAFGWAGVLIFMALAFSLPVFGFLIACSHSALPLSSSGLLIRRMAHLTSAAIPLYTATGVYLLIFDLPGWTAWGWDVAVWTAAWLAIFAFVLGKAGRHPAETDVRQTEPPTALRWAHGIGAAILILIFLAGHLANHVTGVFGHEAHRTVIDALRIWYRSGYVEPVIVCGFLFMMASGMALARYRTVMFTDALGTLQTMTGVYLAAFLFSHMAAVLILARGKYGVDTDWLYATGAPQGLFAEPGNVRLIPHYTWVVAAFVAHAACGLRVIMLAHGVRKSFADRTAWSITFAGAALAVIIMVAMLGATATA